MIIQDKDGKLKWSSIVAYLPSYGENPFALADKSIQNIMNNKAVNEMGIYKFLDFTGKLLYQVEYREGRLFSWGSPVRKDLLPTKKKIVNEKMNSMRGGETCVEYYLETTYYYSDGTTTQTSEFLFIICEEDNDGGVGGNGGEDDVDYEIETEESALVTPTTFGDNDIAYDPYTTIDGGSPMVHQVECRLNVRRKIGRILRAIISMTVHDPVLIGDTNIQYYNPFKQSQCIRNVAIVTISKSKSIDPLGVTASAGWSWELNYRYSYFMNHPTETSQFPDSRTGYVNAYSTG
ncbi:MAG: hypothetical protein EOO85_30270, partial [Pedobacter sp.]